MKSPINQEHMPDESPHPLSQQNLLLEKCIAKDLLKLNMQLIIIVPVT